MAPGCYESLSTVVPPLVPVASEGGATLRTERFFEFDLDLLPADPSPPDMWQEQAACFGIDPDMF